MPKVIQIHRNQHLRVLAHRFLTVGDPNRLKILCTLFNGKDQCVSEVAQQLGLSIAIVSHHLKILSRAGIVSAVRQGKRVCYQVAKDAFINDLKHLICKHQ